MTSATISESRLGPLILVVFGAAAIYFALEVELTSYRTAGREPLVLLCGVVLAALGLGRFFRPTEMTVHEAGLSIRRLAKRELFLSWQSIAGFYEKYPTGIGINLNQPVPSYKSNRWLDGGSPDQIVLFGLWSDRTATVSHLNELLETQASSSMSQ